MGRVGKVGPLVYMKVPPSCKKVPPSCKKVPPSCKKVPPSYMGLSPSYMGLSPRYMGLSPSYTGLSLYVFVAIRPLFPLRAFVFSWLFVPLESWSLGGEESTAC